jgi:hypothetical protein
VGRRRKAVIYKLLVVLAQVVEVVRAGFGSGRKRVGRSELDVCSMLDVGFSGE